MVCVCGSGGGGQAGRLVEAASRVAVALSVSWGARRPQPPHLAPPGLNGQALRAACLAPRPPARPRLMPAMEHAQSPPGNAYVLASRRPSRHPPSCKARRPTRPPARTPAHHAGHRACRVVWQGAHGARLQGPGQPTLQGHGGGRQAAGQHAPMHEEGGKTMGASACAAWRSRPCLVLEVQCSGALRIRHTAQLAPRQRTSICMYTHVACVYT